MHCYLLIKVRNRLAHERNRMWRYLPVGKISLLGSRRLSDRETFQYRLMRTLGDLSSEFDRRLPANNESESILREAASAYNHCFDLLGSGPRHLDPINWHSDFKTGYVWEKGSFYKDYNVDVKTDEVDGKVPWELNRCQHLLWLSEAYKLTSDEKYAQEVVNEIEEWIKENPLMHSVNWTCSMDVAFRSVNWLYAVALISNSKAITSAFIRSFSQSLFQHGFFISNNLEKSIPYSNNHYFSDIVGLLYIGSFFIDLSKGKRWYNYAKKELFKEVILQTLPSGANYERSISYHRMVTEMASAAYYLVRRNGDSIPANVAQRVKGMYGFVHSYIKPGGLAPQVEDNDDGRFLPLVRRDFRYHGYLLNKHSLELRMMRSGDDEQIDVLPKTDYSDAGYWIYRFGDAYLLFTNGRQSRVETDAQHVTTHTHNDLLSFELTLGPDDIIIDPGTYQYLFASENNPHGRNEFRSTSKHNTIMVDNEEQHFLSNQNLFLITKNSIIDGENSYHTIKGDMHHKREIYREESLVVIKDNVEKKGARHQLVSRFHIAPTVGVSLKDNKIDMESGHYQVILSVSASTLTSVSVIDDVVSPSYGILTPSKTVEVRTSFNDNFTMETKIEWKKRR